MTNLPPSPAFSSLCAANPICDSNGLLLCDFDGTISFRDVTDTLLAQFGQDGCEALEQAWEAGEIGSRECMQGQIALLQASPQELHEVLDQIEIDPDFQQVVALAQQTGITIQIVSDGLDYAIQHILQRHDLGFLPIYANQLRYCGERCWQLDFPYANAHCQKKSGNCKCAHLQWQRQQCSAPITYIGDGASDFCVAEQMSCVIAKDRLITYCQQRGIPHHAVNGFAEVIALWPTLFEMKSDRC